MEPTEEQFLVINALETLKFLLSDVYDDDTGIWYIETLSPVLKYAQIMPDGEITVVEAGSGR